MFPMTYRPERCGVDELYEDTANPDHALNAFPTTIEAPVILDILL